jgi:hypothetical protein
MTLDEFKKACESATGTVRVKTRNNLIYHISPSEWGSFLDSEDTMLYGESEKLYRNNQERSGWGCRCRWFALKNIELATEDDRSVARHPLKRRRR